MALTAGETNPQATATLAKGHMRFKQDLLMQALEGRFQPHHRFTIAEWLSRIDSLDETIARFDASLYNQWCFYRLNSAIDR